MPSGQEGLTQSTGQGNDMFSESRDSVDEEGRRVFQAGETVCAGSLMWGKHGMIKEPKEAE